MSTQTIGIALLDALGIPTKNVSCVQVVLPADGDSLGQIHVILQGSEIEAALGDMAIDITSYEIRERPAVVYDVAEDAR